MTIEDNCTSFNSLANEIVEEILLCLTPREIAAVSVTCKRIHSIIQEPIFYKRLHDIHYDATNQPVSSYASTVIGRAKAIRELENCTGSKGHSGLSRGAIERDETLDALAGLATTCCSEESKNAAILDRLFKANTSALLYFLGPLEDPSLNRLLRSRANASKRWNSVSRSLLLVLAGPSPQTWESRIARRSNARGILYRKANFPSFGPFKHGTDVVDWHLLEAIAISIYTNVEEALSEWSIDPTAIPTSFAQSLPSPPLPLSKLDWADVESRDFHGTYSFVDFRIYQMYNAFEEEIQLPHLAEVAEATGDILSMRLHITNRDELENSTEKYATIKFKGKSGITRQSSHDFYTDIAGTVKRSSEGYFIWQWSVAYDGARRWLLTCVQIGSGGLLGLWSDFSDPEDGPTGPVYYWRV